MSGQLYTDEVLSLCSVSRVRKIYDFRPVPFINDTKFYLLLFGCSVGCCESIFLDSHRRKAKLFHPGPESDPAEAKFLDPDPKEAKLDPKPDPDQTINENFGFGPEHNRVRSRVWKGQQLSTALI
jgi:hypothetical protein